MTSALIAGGGVAGLTAALSLVQRGFSVTVLERASAIGEIGAGIQLGANAIAVLSALGLGDEIAALARHPEAVELLDGLSGKALARIPFGETSRARYGHPHAVIHRADLIDCLLNAATASGVHLQTDARVDGVDATGFRVSDGTTFTAPVLVAADGLNSTLRPYVAGDASPSFAGHVAWRALVPMGEDLPSLTRNWLLPGRHVVTYPLRKGGETLMNIVAISANAEALGEAWHIQADPAQLRAAFDDAAPPLRTLLAKVETCGAWGLYTHRVPRWSRDNLVLIGDAAHPMLPYLAQGGAMGIEDGWALAAALGEANTVSDAFSRFETIRRPRTSAVARSSAQSGRIYHLSGPMRLARNAVLRMTPPRRLLTRLDQIYGYDSVASALARQSETTSGSDIASTHSKPQ